LKWSWRSIEVRKCSWSYTDLLPKKAGKMAVMREAQHRRDVRDCDVPLDEQRLRVLDP
jgi:hypothetical protein